MGKFVASLLMAGSLLTLAPWAGAQEVAPSKIVRPVPQTGLPPAPSPPPRAGQQANGKPGYQTPRASRVPVKPLLQLDEKNLGLGCAQPS